MAITSVLIVDDSEMDRYLLKRQIKDAGIFSYIFEANDGEKALDFFRNGCPKNDDEKEQFPPKIIFLDINMPLINGFEFLEEFSQLRKAEESYKSTIVLMYTSSARKEDREKAFSFKFVKDYLVKGEINADLVREKSKKYLD